MTPKIKIQDLESFQKFLIELKRKYENNFIEFCDRELGFKLYFEQREALNTGGGINVIKSMRGRKTLAALRAVLGFLLYEEEVRVFSKTLDTKSIFKYAHMMIEFFFSKHKEHKSFVSVEGNMISMPSQNSFIKFDSLEDKRPEEYVGMCGKQTIIVDHSLRVEEKFIDVFKGNMYDEESLLLIVEPRDR